MLEKIKNWVLDIIFPIPDLPPGLTINRTLFCAICRARLPENKKICHRQAPYMLGAAVNYSETAIRQMIWRLKYRGRTGIAFLLARLLHNYLQNIDLKLKNYLIVPLPLSKERQRERGYNQAALIAKIVAEDFKMEFAENLLIRTKHASPQVKAGDWMERKKNVADCFACLKGVEGRNIMLIDDVTTSGATLNEAAKTLKAGGAKKIIGLVVAKA